MTYRPSSRLRIGPFGGETTSECSLPPLRFAALHDTARSVTMGIQNMPWDEWIEVSVLPPIGSLVPCLDRCLMI